MVTDMRPLLRVESADMRELMLGFAERFRSEAAIAIDLLIEDRNLRLPDRLFRELSITTATRRAAPLRRECLSPCMRPIRDRQNNLHCSPK
jgi:hypothetical protein